MAAPNTFGYQFQGGKRGAIVIGVNSYPTLPKEKQLLGATNDAKEVFEKLKSQGSFDTGKLLIEEDATCDKIRSMIYDILFDEENGCDKVIFYFAGHGFRDPFDNTFIAPFDFMPTKPFYKGISMKELNTIFSNFHSASTKSRNKVVCTFLDCCHSGEFIIGGRGGGGGNRLDQSKFREQAQKSWSGGQGIIGLASMDSEGTARETKLPHNFGEQAEHPHGIFTYHLIESLEGTYSDEGIITFSELTRKLNEQMAKGNQQLYPLVEGQGDILEFELVLARRNIEKYVSSLLAGCKLPSDGKITLFSLNDTIQNIVKLKTFELYYKQNEEYLNQCMAEVGSQISRFQLEIADWIEQNITNDSNSRNSLNNIEASLFDNLYLLPNNSLSSFDTFIDAFNDKFKSCLLIGLGVVINNPQHADAHTFIQACKLCVNKYLKTPDAETAKGVVEASSSPSRAHKLEYGEPRK